MQDKVINLPGLTLTTGTTVNVFFSNGNSAELPRLKVNSNDAIPIIVYLHGSKKTVTTQWDAGTSMTLMYDGTDFVVLGNPVVMSKWMQPSSNVSRHAVKYASGLLKQWGTITLSDYTGDSLSIEFSIPYSSKEYTFIYGGINYKFPTSTNETALRLWVKYTGSVKISATQRDVPLYKTLDWFTIGYAK